MNKIDNVFVKTKTVKTKTVKAEPVIVPGDPVVNQPMEQNVEIPLRRFQPIRRPALLDDMFTYIGIILILILVAPMILISLMILIFLKSLFKIF